MVPELPQRHRIAALYVLPRLVVHDLGDAGIVVGAVAELDLHLEPGSLVWGLHSHLVQSAANFHAHHLKP